MHNLNHLSRLKLKHLSLLALAALAAHTTGAQAQAPHHDKGTFIEYKPGFFENSILRGIDAFEKKEEAPKPARRSFKVDLSTFDVPKSPAEFTTAWCSSPVSQGNTGTCWCFSTTSSVESEIKRQTKQEIRVSEAYTVYWEYVEKARRFLQERGNSVFDEGSEANGVFHIMKQYGAMPREQYTGLLPGQSYYDHTKMAAEMRNYLEHVKQANAWNEAEALATIKSILNHYMGEPPTTVAVNGKKMSPQDYMAKVLKFVPDDMVNIYSLMNAPYYQRTEYAVPDNWWHSTDYYNVPLDAYMAALKSAIKAGYTFTIGGDVSEAGLVTGQQAAVVPSFDIPSEYIDESARQFRFSNGTTTDDHGMHVVGYKAGADGKWWFLVKDSGAGSRNTGSNPGYYYFHEDYIKLKMLYFTVHKDAVKDLLAKFKDVSVR